MCDHHISGPATTVSQSHFLSSHSSLAANRPLKASDSQLTDQTLTVS